MSTYAIHKRYACDRCRDQKLRCLRDEHNGPDEACARCQRAGALCVTSDARPLGRPRSTVSNTNTNNSADPLHPRKRARGSVTSLAPSSKFAETPTSTPTSTATTAAAPPMMSWLTTTAMPDSASLSPLALGDASFENLFGLTSPGGDMAGYHMYDAGQMLMGSPCDDVIGDQLELERDSLSESPAVSVTDTLLALSSLSESVTRQLSKIDSYPWQSPQMMQSACSAKSNSTVDNPVAEALHSTASFMTILKRLSPAPTPRSPGAWSASDSGVSAMGSSTNNGSAASPPSPLNTATYLLLLSTYLQVMQLFNIMFCRLAEYLSDATEESLNGFRTQSEFRVAGLPAMPNRLYIKVVVQVIDHHVEGIERSMGLAAEYRVSGRASPAMGIFSGQDVIGLLQTVMGARNGGDGGQENKNTGRSLVVSLRDNMAKVQELLRG
ncbi:hypothetical protein QBC43DRAFT_50272 [Cladorrhinum sp. PSN259]|nr:hypothetical protein QBC43DRAFT_50272 [Cladorrhinum sp. PSN259]